MKKLDFQESLERYKKYYPENCIGKSDIEILLHRKVISEEEAWEMLNPPVKEKLLTEKQYMKLINENIKGSANEYLKDINYGRPENEWQQAEDIAYDLATRFLFEYPEVKEYLKAQGVNDPIGCIAEYTVD